MTEPLPDARSMATTPEGDAVITNDLRPTIAPPADMPRGQRILITGGTGFIGTALTDRLCGENEVVMFDHKLDGSSWTLSPHNGSRKDRKSTRLNSSH